MACEIDFIGKSSFLLNLRAKILLTSSFVTLLTKASSEKMVPLFRAWLKMETTKLYEHLNSLAMSSKSPPLSLLVTMSFLAFAEMRSSAKPTLLPAISLGPKLLTSHRQLAAVSAWVLP